MKRELPTLQDTAKLAGEISKLIEPPMCIALNGTLVAGKTQFTRNLATACGVESQQVTSPTYVLHQLYHGEITIHHFDFYRLESAHQVWDLGIEELFELHVLVVIEWAQKFPDCLPDDFLSMNFSESESGPGREVEFGFSGPRSQKLHSDLLDQD